ncbi:MAG: hypothetical protein PWQ60_1285 [Thermoanaerobacteraceae bacterium]|nr:hypothetical protein [Thermoanaerobacteraceae bacterium]MDN5313010.1 hypothetical protein [Thermoanaerobacteraceae bacterium]
MQLWDKDVERKFFEESLKIATPEQLFYVTENNEYVAYWPKGYKGKKSTLQSRNSFIGTFTEKWISDLMNKIVIEKGLFATTGVVCPEIELTESSPADVAITVEKGKNQKAEGILLIIEVKMSIVWNWKYINDAKEGQKLVCIGDFQTHQGNPGLLRSDSMLKAIGKSINIRVSSNKASKIPIIVITNTPITNSYYEKVDNIKKAGVIQGFFSVNPKPMDGLDNSLKQTEGKGYYKFDSFNEIRGYINSILQSEINFFSGMKNKEEIGRIIEIANKEDSYEKKGEAFLKLIRR